METHASGFRLRASAPEGSVYVANKMESYEQELGKFWMPNVVNATWGTGRRNRPPAW